MGVHYECGVIEAFFIRIISRQVFNSWCETIDIKNIYFIDTTMLFLDTKSESFSIAFLILDFVVNECSISC